MGYGLIIFFVIILMGGIIAYIGDNLGSKIGKRRMTLFGLRPKHTSILVTILTGILIAGMTLGVMSIVSENVRIALFGMEQLQAKTNELTKQVDEKNGELGKKTALLVSQEKEIDSINDKVKMTTMELSQAEEARDNMSDQLAVVQSAYDQAAAKLSGSEAEIKSLEETKKELTGNVDRLNDHINELNGNINYLADETKQLSKGLANLRDGTVLFRVGEVLSSAVVEPNLNEEQCKGVLTKIMNDTNNLVRTRLGVTDQNAVILYISKDEFNNTVQTMRNSKVKKLVRITAAGNVVLGEAAVVNVQLFDDTLIYHKGDIIFSGVINANSEDSSVELQTIQFLKQVNREATAKGILSDPITGTVGALTGVEMFSAIKEIQSYRGAVAVSAVALHDIYTEGPVNIDIKSKPQNWV